MKKIIVLIIMSISLIGCGSKTTLESKKYSINKAYSNGQFEKILSYTESHPYYQQNDSMKVEYLKVLNQLSILYESAFHTCNRLILDHSPLYLSKYSESIFAPYVAYQYAVSLILKGDINKAETILDKLTNNPTNDPKLNHRINIVKLQLKNNENFVSNYKYNNKILKNSKDLLSFLDVYIPLNTNQNSYKISDEILSPELLTIQSPAFIVDSVAYFYDIRLLKYISLVIDKHILHYSQKYPLSDKNTWFYYDERFVIYNTSVRINNQNRALKTLDEILDFLRIQDEGDKWYLYFKSLKENNPSGDSFSNIDSIYTAYGWYLNSLLHGQTQQSNEYFKTLINSEINISELDYEKKNLDCNSFMKMYFAGLYSNQYLNNLSENVFKYLRNQQEGYAVKVLSANDCILFDPYLFLIESANGLRNVRPTNELILNTISNLGKKNNLFRILTKNYYPFAAPYRDDGQIMI